MKKVAKKAAPKKVAKGGKGKKAAPKKKAGGKGKGRKWFRLDLNFGLSEKYWRVLFDDPVVAVLSIKPYYSMVLSNNKRLNIQTMFFISFYLNAVVR